MLLKLAYSVAFLLTLSVVSCEPIPAEERESSSSSSSSSSVSQLNIYQALPTHPGYLGTRIQSNAACESEYATNKSTWTNVKCTNFVALLGYATDSGVQDLATDFSIPTSVPIKTIDNVTFSSNYTNLITSGPSITMSTSDQGIHDVEAMTGFTNGGAVDSNCSEWSSGASAATFTGIDISFASANWDGISGDCTAEIKPFFCLCW